MTCWNIKFVKLCEISFDCWTVTLTELCRKFDICIFVKCKYNLAFSFFPEYPFYLAHSQNCEKRQLALSCLFVRLSARNNSAPSGRIFVKFDIWVFFENLSRTFKFHLNLTRITGTVHEDLYTFMIISLSILLRMRNVSDKSFRENQNTHFMFNNFSRKSCRLWQCGKYGAARRRHMTD
jgi:hypothetical protein